MARKLLVLLTSMVAACSSGAEPAPDSSAAGEFSAAGSQSAGMSSGGMAGAPLGSGGVTTAGGGSDGGAAGGAGAAGAISGGGNAGGASGARSGGSAGQTAGGGGGGGQAPLLPVTVYLAGDSTVSTYKDTASTQDQAGWGQMLHEYLSDLVTVDNRAVGGRTSRRFIEEGHLDEILADVKPGDYLLVQFGTNDGNKTATYTWQGQSIPYYLDPETDFKSYIQQYIDGARAHGATPALVTPPPRNSAYCTGGNGTGAHAAAMRELAQSAKVALLDLNQKSVDYLKAICPAPTPENFFLLKPDGGVDGTHFQEHGARTLAGFVASSTRDASLPLASYLK